MKCEKKSAEQNAALSPSEGPKLTLIIPCYNTPAEYLERCADSICRQTFPDYEAIFVDDGSDERHLEVLQDMVKRDVRFSLVQLPHRGVSAARNAALNRMRGEYVTFVDSDDELMDGFLEAAVFALESEGLDIVYGKIEKTHKGKSTTTLDPFSPDMSIYEGESLTALQRCVVSTLPPAGYDELRHFNSRAVAAKVYCAALLDGLRFQEEVHFSEDHLFNSEAIGRASRVALVNRVWYRYYKNSGSASLNSNKLVDNCCGYIESLHATGKRLGWKKCDMEFGAIMSVLLVLDAMVYCGCSNVELRAALGSVYRMPSFPRALPWREDYGFQLTRRQRFKCWVLSRRLRFVYIALFRVKRQFAEVGVPG